MNQDLNSAIISLGSNCGNKVDNVRKALDWLKITFDYCEASKIYETPEIHGIGVPYMNAVCECRVSCSLSELEEITKCYEKENGRDAEARMRGDVPIDIDIVVWNDEVVREHDFDCSFFKIGLKTLQCADKEIYLSPNISH